MTFDPFNAPRSGANNLDLFGGTVARRQATCQAVMRLRRTMQRAGKVWLMEYHADD